MARLCGRTLAKHVFELATSKLESALPYTVGTVQAACGQEE